jgi:hypothetical protein
LEKQEAKKTKSVRLFGKSLADEFMSRYGMSSKEAEDAGLAIPLFFTSAQTGEGVLELKEFIARRSERHGVPMQVLTQLLAVVKCLTGIAQPLAPAFYMKTEKYHMEEMVATYKKKMIDLVDEMPALLRNHKVDLKAWEGQLASGNSGIKGLLSAVTSCSDETKWNTGFLDSALEVVQEMLAPVVDQLNRLVLALEAILNRTSLTSRLLFQEAAATLQAFRSTTELQRLLRRAVANVVSKHVKDFSGKAGKGAWDALAEDISMMLKVKLPEQIREGLQAEVDEKLEVVLKQMDTAYTAWCDKTAVWSLENLGSAPATSEYTQVFILFS